MVLPLILGLQPLPSLSAGESFDYFQNSWTLIGLKDYEHGTRISPDNQLLIGADPGQGESEADKATVELCYGRHLTPLSREQTKTLLDGWLPIILISASDGWVRYDFTLWATPLPSVKDWEKAFGWPAEGENFLNWIQVKATNTGAHPAEAKVKIGWYGSPSETGQPEMLSMEPVVSTWTLASGEHAECVARVPWSPVQPASDFAGEDPDLWLSRTEKFWRDLLESAALIEVPCEKARQALYASHVYQLITNDHGVVHGGEGFYDEFYIRDGAYQVMEFEEAGLSDTAEKAIRSFLAHQREDGRFESQKGQFDANGQDLWALWEYYKITGDLKWLEQAYPQMRKAVSWIMKARSEAPADSPFAGLLPNAVADGEYLWKGDHHIVGYDFWNLRGLLCTADAARVLGKTSDADLLSQEAERFRAAINAAQDKTGLTYFPPSWEKEGTHWGNTETLWPAGIFDPNDPRVTGLMKAVRETHGGGFKEGTIRWLGGAPAGPGQTPEAAIHPYMSAYTTMASLVRGEDERVVAEFYWYLLHSTATHAFPEGIFFGRRFAWSNTIPHATGACNYALLLRHMLVHEEGDELHLLSAIPDWWLSEGQEIRIERLPTHFGEMSLCTHGEAEGIHVEIDPPHRNPPKRIVLHLPRQVTNPLEGVEVSMRPPQTKRWDFQAVIDLSRSESDVK
jgi:hypothetical protein